VLVRVVDEDVPLGLPGEGERNEDREDREDRGSSWDGGELGSDRTGVRRQTPRVRVRAIVGPGHVVFFLVFSCLSAMPL
jgi:hypothetical protein